MPRFSSHSQHAARKFLLVVAGLVFPAPAQASTIIFATGVQHLTSDINVRAQFDIDNTAQTVTIHLLNLQVNPAGITSVLGSVRFNITGAGTTPTPNGTIGSNISTFGVDKNGNPVTQSGTNTWTANNIGGNTIGFCTVCASGGNNDLVIGGPNASGLYTGNNSVGPAHSPFIIGSGLSYSAPSVLAGLNTAPSWTIHFNGITQGQSVTISNVIFGFGTGTNYGTDFYTMPNYTEYDAPEPESNIMVVTGLGLVLAAVAMRRIPAARLTKAEVVKEENRA
jgi:hypothetical protein